MRRFPIRSLEGSDNGSPTSKRLYNPQDGRSGQQVEGSAFGALQVKGPCVCLIRAPIMPLLSVDKEPSMLFRPFKSPLEGHQPGISEESLKKTLGVRIKRSSAFASAAKQFKSPPPLAAVQAPAVNPLVLYKPPPDRPNEHTVEVDPMLTRWLREHQRQGVQFIFDCLMGLKDFDGEGCILADDMGLGKTLQSISIIWTLLQQGLYGKPAVRRAVVVCPASLVNNWASEINKWLEGKCKCTAVADNCKNKVVSKFEGFRYDRESRILISSYETFRMHASRLEGVPVDLVVCDEAHRLKNDRTKTALAISELPARKRLLLSGTPIQNDLDEFYALVSLCNPSAVGDAHTFRKRYASPILAGREPDASEEQQRLAAERLTELSSLTNLFILRRTNSLLARVLPPKVVLNVFCRLTPVQKEFYRNFLSSKSCRKIFSEEAEKSSGFTGRVLSSIQGLMKLCNHPSLVKSQCSILQGFEKCENFFEELDIGQKARCRSIRPELSGKLMLLSRLLDVVRTTTNDKIVLISNYTQTLDLFEKLCRDKGYPVVRLDGHTSIKKRHALITKFNDPIDLNGFVFLLSSKAGGCGVNLIGANRLVLFDPDWNPANDKQALARVWRDGQKKTCFIYRFFSTGTIEEKIYQRQICKDSLSAMLVSEGENQLKDSLSTDLVKDLFRLKEDTVSDTHDMLGCARCRTPDIETREASGEEAQEHQTRSVVYTEEQLRAFSVPQQEVSFDEDDLLTWAHHWDLDSLPDACLRVAAQACIEEEALSHEAEVSNHTAVNKESLDFSDKDVYASECKGTGGGRHPISFAMSCRIEFTEDLAPPSPTHLPQGSEESGRPVGHSPCKVVSRSTTAATISESHSKRESLSEAEDEDFVMCISEDSSEDD